MRQMGNELKKRYEKPKITKINLDAKTAVLAVCKTSGKFGSGKAGCRNHIGQLCNQEGS